MESLQCQLTGLKATSQLVMKSWKRRTVRMLHIPSVWLYQSIYTEKETNQGRDKYYHTWSTRLRDL